MSKDIGLISEKTGFNAKEHEYRNFLQDHPLPVPSKEQMEWLDLELGMFVHFGINTYHDLEWSDGGLDPGTFNPEKLDCNQWVQVAKDMGARYMVLTAKHHDGFCLWQTNTTDYSVRRSPWKDGKGDVVREFIDACKKAGMRAGVYLSPWDRHEPCYADKEAYDSFYAAQLTELLTMYDFKYTELWFDGAGSVGREYDWKRIIGICKEFQPQALIFNMGEPTIRWAGNENGLAPYPLWNVVSKDEYPGLKDGKADFLWLPAECDMPIRYHTWFYNTGNEVMVSPVEELFRCYIGSVGCGANLLLNIAPGRDGLIPVADWTPAKEFGSTVERLFSNSVAETSGSGSSIDLNLETPMEISCIDMREDISQGQRVTHFEIKGKTKNGWKTLVVGKSVGHRHLSLIEPIQISALRVEFINSFAEPIIKSLKVYHSPEFEEFRKYSLDDNVI
ncbi:MAG: alpha-L-fucosidase [Promethearchaeota archaeon]